MENFKSQLNLGIYFIYFKILNYLFFHINFIYIFFSKIKYRRD